MSGPTTKAGRTLLSTWLAGRTHPPSAQRLRDFTDLVVAIEAEAIATYAATLRERIEGLREHRPAGIGPVPHEIRREAFREVLALLDEARTAERPRCSDCTCCSAPKVFGVCLACSSNQPCAPGECSDLDEASTAE